MTPRFIRNVLLKAMVLFAILNLLWAAFTPTSLGRLSSYNILLRGRERLPFGEDSTQSYNLSLYNLDAMFASHKLAGIPKPADEFRVIVIGDSSAWGTLLRPEETLAGQLDAAALMVGDRKVKAYNLGYPTLSLTKDLMVLERSLRYEPDLILWPLTLESFPRGRQAESPIVANNPAVVNALINGWQLDLPELQNETTFWQRTLIGQRRELADLLRLQLYGVMWSATGIDQTYPADYERAAIDLEADATFNGWQPGEMSAQDLAFDLVAAGVKMAGDTPVVLINEPILVSNGLNSDLRYNFYYPRWAYDQYRGQFAAFCDTNALTCLDLWDAVPQEHFTNSAIHLDPQGERMLMERIIQSGVIEP